MIHRVQFEQWVPDGVEQVFRFFANPNNLPRVMPPDTGTTLVDVSLVPPPAPQEEIQISNSGLAGAGSEIVTSFRIIPFIAIFRTQWIAVITEFEWNHHFADMQKQGPFKRFQHRHEFSGETQNGVDGTRVRDVIEYDAGWGIFGDLANRLFIASSLKKTFEYRQKTLEKLLR